MRLTKVGFLGQFALKTEYYNKVKNERKGSMHLCSLSPLSLLTSVASCGNPASVSATSSRRAAREEREEDKEGDHNLGPHCVSHSIVEISVT